MNTKPISSKKQAIRNERGIAAINGVFMAVMMATAAGVTIDIGHAVLTQHQLQNAADAAALSAGTRMGQVYLGMPEAEQSDMSRDLTSNEQAQVFGMATNTAWANMASDLSNLALGQNDLVYGTWNFGSHTFTPSPSATRPTAVQVTVQRANGAANGPISTFFAGMLGVNTLDVGATAIAALSTAGGPSGPGAADAPFGISQAYFSSNTGCGDIITFSPTGSQTGCAGWHIFDEVTGGGNQPQNCSTTSGGGGDGSGGANAIMMRRVIDCINAGNYTSPPIIPGVTQFNFTGGQVSTAFSNLKNLFDNHKDSNGEWHIDVPVYQATDCSNPSGPITIVGYANVKVTQVIPPQGQGQAYIQGEIECNVFFNAAPSPNPGGGGGGPWSPISPIARLVS